ncbi:hypothetical protein FB45DRAFT_915087 [Roridomyces roridus]|uniref:Uncharacterized protein n=1 Tax=Roridomyces roridus TaxID=1738132 RepID=A0AAD7BT42_9AGAR|nr:hypothetical protein FB45DRAFT_915087 [Roridomyces roridus]
MSTSVPPPSPSPTPSPASKTSSPLVIPIAVSVLFAVLLLACLMFISLYLRRRNKQRSRKGAQVRAGETVSRTHPAALMITPAEGNGTPRFVHTPGTNMRIANRRADGGWEFSDPRAPFTPSIVEARDRSPPRAYSPYSHYDTPRSSTSDLLPPTTAASGSPWGALKTPRTADSDSSAAPWRVVSPAPSTARSAFLPIPPPSGGRDSTDSFLDLDADDSRQATSSSTRRSPLSPPARVHSPARDRIPSPSPALPSASAHPQSHLRPPRARAVTPESDALMTPAARAKAAESRAARAIRAGYDSVDRYSEYAQQDEGLPAY